MFFFFLNDTATTEIYTLPLHDALPISSETFVGTLNEDFAIESLAGDIFQLGNTSYAIKRVGTGEVRVEDAHGQPPSIPDRKSTRLNSSHSQISYAVFCLKKKNITTRLLWPSYSCASSTWTTPKTNVYRSRIM